MKLNKTIMNYVILAIAAFAFNNIYSLFGHGVTSSWMSNMYLYLLGLGALVFLLIKLFIPNIIQCKGYRLFYNIYNSGVAVLINGMLLKGILDIAGSTSYIVPWFLYVGCGLIVLAAIIFFLVAESRESRGRFS
jgi:Protein of unknown function (DUF2871).